MPAVEEAQYIRVTNTQPRLVHLPPKLSVKKNGDSPHDQFYGHENFKTLKPGGNNVDRTYWEYCKSRPVIQMFIESGLLKEGGDVSQPEGPEAPPSLSGYGEPASIALLEAEDDIKTLRKWDKAEKRPQVKQALLRRFEKLGKK